MTSTLKWSAKRLILLVCRVFRIDLLTLAHNRMGILNYQNSTVSGELMLANRWLPDFLTNKGIVSPCLFDVGANVGDITRLLKRAVPRSTVYAFEPNASAYSQLQRVGLELEGVETFNIALGKCPSTMTLYSDAANPASSHATLFRDVLSRLHQYQEIVSSKVDVMDLDTFCREHGIDTVHFLKIDTEGSEFEVLRGADEMIRSGKVHAIQFEFNEMNVISRVFLKDFVDFLDGYQLYRLLPERLMPISYSPRDEIFQFQNILAVRRD